MIEIKEVEPSIAYEVSTQIAELFPPYPWSKWEERLSDKDHICLVAYSDTGAVGCKVGYFETDHFYSWVGGVCEPWRRKGIASLLAARMEELARARGAVLIRMKTMNKFRAMLLFALGSGFEITNVEPGLSDSDPVKIVLEKKL